MASQKIKKMKRSPEKVIPIIAVIIPRSRVKYPVILPVTSSLIENMDAVIPIVTKIKAINMRNELKKPIAEEGECPYTITPSLEYRSRIMSERMRAKVV
jgi:hypothetical protein